MNRSIHTNVYYDNSFVPGPGVVYALHEDEGQGARASSRQYILNRDKYNLITSQDVLCVQPSPCKQPS